MKQASTFVVLFVVLVFVVVTFKVKEPFKNPNLVIQSGPIAQRNIVQSSKNGDFAPTCTSMAGPAPGTIASINSLPYRDPSFESATYKKLLNVQTTLKGFLQNEAKNIQDTSDISIEIPLTTARSDLNRLENELSVLKRNPGINSSIDQGDLDDISANLSWLQNKYRNSIYNEVEGFFDMTDNMMDGSGSMMSSMMDGLGSMMNNMIGSTSILDSSTTRTNSDASGSAVDNTKCTKQDLSEIILRIDANIVRLSASGTNQPTVLRTIEVLRQIKKTVQDILDEVNSGARSEKDIPITKDSKDNFLKAISNNNSPIPNLVGSNVYLSDLFNPYSQGDVSGAQFAQYLFEKYADMLFRGLSWDFNLKYISDNEVSLGNKTRYNDSISRIPTPIHPPMHFPNQGYFNNVIENASSNIDFNKPVYKQPQNQIFDYTSIIPKPINTTPGNSNNNNYEKRFEPAPPNKSSHFDWHERANYICEAIQKRGMNPKDFGCLGNKEYVSENFSWRGYAKMICTRLGTSYDTGLPETCGCPPFNWAGWKP
jgi:hypothetical protein